MKEELNKRGLDLLTERGFKLFYNRKKISWMDLLLKVY